MGTKGYEMPEKLTVKWGPEGKAIIDTWKSHFVSLEEFKNVV